MDEAEEPVAERDDAAELRVALAVAHGEVARLTAERDRWRGLAEGDACGRDPHDPGSAEGEERAGHGAADPDAAELSQTGESDRLVAAELQNRVRDILALVRSVFGRTMNTGGDLGELVAHFQGRLDSLARTQSVAARTGDGRIDLENLIRDELMSVGVSDGPELAIAGPDVALSVKAAETIGLAIHELVTNALKFGALKAIGGRLAIRWTVAVTGGGEDRRLDLEWTESGVPAVPLQPARYGFGSELIREALPYQLGGLTTLEFRGGGVRCTIAVPLP